jgi:hypothetical protein
MSNPTGAMMLITGRGKEKVQAGGDGQDINAGINGVGEQESQDHGNNELPRIMGAEYACDAPADHQADFGTDELDGGHEWKGDERRPESGAYPNCAPVMASVPIPNGSSSEAPVIKPGPSILKKRLTEAFVAELVQIEYRHFARLLELKLIREMHTVGRALWLPSRLNTALLLSQNAH